MKRFWIVLMAVAVAMVMALPATAKKGGNHHPGPPDDERLLKGWTAPGPLGLAASGLRSSAPIWRRAPSP